ncbi:hypothetical protein ACRAWD_18710 [Caulobacter segnis]
MTSWITPDLQKAFSALHMDDVNYGKTVTTTPGTVWTSPFGNSCFTSGCGLYNLGREPSSGQQLRDRRADTTATSRATSSSRRSACRSAATWACATSRPARRRSATAWCPRRSAA